MSLRCSTVAIHDGSTCGSTPPMNSWALEPPAALMASRGPSSICSIASAKSLEIMPIECRPMARMPGRAPMENTRMNTMAKTTSGMARVKTVMKRPTAWKAGPGVVLAAAM